MVSVPATRSARPGFESRPVASPQSGLRGGRLLFEYCTNKLLKVRGSHGCHLGITWLSLGDHMVVIPVMHSGWDGRSTVRALIEVLHWFTSLGDTEAVLMKGIMQKYIETDLALSVGRGWADSGLGHLPSSTPRRLSRWCRRGGDAAPTASAPCRRRPSRRSSCHW